MRPQSFHNPLVLLARIGHQEMIHRDRVSEAADLAALGGHHARRMAEPGRELVQLFVRAVNQDQPLFAGGDVL